MRSAAGTTEFPRVADYPMRQFEGTFRDRVWGRSPPTIPTWPEAGAAVSGRQGLIVARAEKGTCDRVCGVSTTKGGALYFPKWEW